MFLLVMVPFLIPVAVAQEEKEEEEKSLEEEQSTLEEDLMYEFAFLEEELAADEVTSASKHRQSIFWSPSAITIFTRDDILASGATTIADLLRRVPGFDVYEMKPSFPLVGARALTEVSNNLVLVLVDGREALIEVSGFCMLAGMTIDLEEIERVEVIRGPGSALYGASAFAGVVSITTVPGSSGDGKVLLSGGEQGHRRLFGRFCESWSLGDGVLSFSAGLGTEGQRSLSDFSDDIKEVQLRSHGQLRYRQGKKLDLSLHAGVVTGGGALYMVAFDMVFQNLIYHYVMGQAEVGLGESVRLKGQFYHSRYYCDFLSRSALHAYGVWLADLPNFILDTNTIDGQFQLDFKAGDRLLLIGGGNLRYTTLHSAIFHPPEISEIRGAGFVNAQWSPWDFVQLIGGLRLDLNSETEEALSPRAVIVFRPWPSQSFRLGYGLAFRKPAFVENQMHLRVESAAFPEVVEKLETALGNEDLVNEKAHSFEAGWRAHFLDDRLQICLDLFYNIYQDMIYFKTEMDWDSLGRPDVINSTFLFVNQDGKVRAIGGEAEAVWRALYDWTFWGNLGLRSVTGEGGGRAPSEPQLRINLGFSWNPPPGTAGWAPLADLALHYVSSYRMPRMHPEEMFDEPELVPLGNSLLAIGRFGYRLSLAEGRVVETGLTVRAPIGRPFREYPGIQVQRSRHTVTASDLGGEMIVRLVSLYLRGSF